MNSVLPDEIRIPRVLSRGGIIFVLLAILIGSLGYDSRDALAVAVVPLVLGTLLLATSARPFRLRFHPDGIECPEENIRVPYGEITHLSLSHRPVFDYAAGKKGWMEIGHPRGSWQLPVSAKVDRVALFRSLLGKTALLSTPGPLPGRLQEALERELADFSPDQVIATTGREPSTHDRPRFRVMWFLFIAVVAGAIAGAAGGADDATAMTFGILAGTFGFLAILFSVLFRARHTALKKMSASAGLIVSPRGLTMESVQLKGFLRWDEVKSLTVVNRASPIMRGILVTVEGSRFMISDQYRCPLTDIHALISRYRAFERKG